MTQSHLIIRNSPVIDDCVADLKQSWREAIFDDHPDYEVIHKILNGERRWFTEYSIILRHRDTDILFEIYYDKAKGEMGEDELRSVRAVVVVPVQITAYDIQDADVNTLHQHVSNERFKELV